MFYFNHLCVRPAGNWTCCAGWYCFRTGRICRIILSQAKTKNVAVNLTIGQWDNCGLALGEMLKKCSPGQRTAHRELLNKNTSLLKDTRLKRGCRQILMLCILLVYLLLLSTELHHIISWIFKVSFFDFKINLVEGLIL